MLHRRTPRQTVFAATCSVLSLASGSGLAAESIVTPGPAGGTDIRQAELPPPGLYGVVAGVGGRLTTIYDNNYHSSDFKGYGLFAGAGLEYVYNFELFGGRFASTISGVGVLAGAGFPGTKTHYSNGATDTYIDVLEYSKFFPSASFQQQSAGSHIPYGLSVMGGLGLELPTGKYKPGAFFNVGSNFFDIVPNIAATYTIPSVFGPAFGQATEISARTFFSNFTKNPKTNYQTGNIIDVDFALTQRAGAFQFGLAGIYFSQIADDRRFGTVVPNRRAENLGLGPIIVYDFLAGGRPFEVAIKSKIPVHERNTVDGPDITIRLALKFF